LFVALHTISEKSIWTLTADNSHTPQNIVRINFKVSQGRFKVISRSLH